jgi:hypothetical protein
MDLGSFEIPSSFPSNGLEGNYICIGVKATDSRDKMSKIYSAKLLAAPIKLWHKMERQVKTKIFKGMFAGIYGKVVILHNPMLPMTPVKEEVKKVKGLSPKHKSIVNSMLENGAGENDESLQEMANELGITFERVKAYIQSF